MELKISYTVKVNSQYPLAIRGFNGNMVSINDLVINDCEWSSFMSFVLKVNNFVY